MGNACAGLHGPPVENRLATRAGPAVEPAPTISGVRPPATAAWVRGLPKAEVHTHLESISTTTLRALAGAAGEPAELVEFAPSGLSELLGWLGWCCGLVRTPADATRVGREFVDRAAASGVRTVDAILNPVHWGRWPGDRLLALLDALAVGFAEAEGGGGPTTRLCLSVLRSQSAEEALELVERMGAWQHPRVAGLSIDGDEAVTGRVSERFAPAFARARALGFATTAHAGESGPAEGVWDALDVLGVQRIDHGFRAIADCELVDRLAAEQVPLGITPTENVVLGYVDELAAHPARALLAAGVPLSVNTDASFSHLLVDEYLACARAFGWGRDELGHLAATSIDASFAPEAERTRLRAELAAYLAAPAPA